MSDEVNTVAAADTQEPEQKEARKSQATQLVELARAADIQLFHTPEAESYIRIPIKGHLETHPLHCKAVRRWLARLFYQEAGTTPGSQALQDALAVLDGCAQYDGDERQVYIRIARLDDATYIDMADDNWRAVKITSEGYGVVPNPPVPFRRPKGMLALPAPEAGGTLDELWDLMNLPDRASRVLMAGTLVGSIRPEGPFTITAATGEQGSAKTTTLRLMRALIDPCSAPVRSAPRDERDLMIAASNSWMPIFDNLSRIPQWLSDAFCRLSTGGGYATRELYSNAEETILDAQRPIGLTSIEDIATRSDLLDRAIIFSLPAIPENKRRTEKALWAEFERIRPRLLGALYNAVAIAMRNLPNTKLSAVPRMADFTLWVTAAESALGLQPGEFVKEYSANRKDANALALEADPLASKVQSLLQEGETWEGKASELLDKLSYWATEAERASDWWPKRADKLSGRLKRLAPNLRQLGVDITLARTNKGSFITIRKDLQSSVTSVTSVTSTPEEVEISDATSQDGDATFAEAESSVTPSYAQSDASDASDAKIHTHSNGTNSNGHSSEWVPAPAGLIMSGVTYRHIDGVRYMRSSSAN